MGEEDGSAHTREKHETDENGDRFSLLGHGIRPQGAVTATLSKKNAGQAVPGPNVDESCNLNMPPGMGWVTRAAPLSSVQIATPAEFTLNTIRCMVPSAGSAALCASVPPLM